jgi:outer membrane murein-binding lipoprotein Lpp
VKKEHFEILLEDIKEKVDLILEGHATLNSKIDRVEDNIEEKIEMLDAKIDSVHNRLNAKIDSVHDRLSAKIDGVANDLAAHRADTESHPKGYRVSDKK